MNETSRAEVNEKKRREERGRKEGCRQWQIRMADSNFNSGEGERDFLKT